MWPFKKESTGIYPHENLPEIRLWEKQDKIDLPFEQDYVNFLKVKENGDCLFYRRFGGDLIVVNVQKIKKFNYVNLTLNKRKKEEKNHGLLMDFQKDKYQEFLRDFQRAYKEIKEA